VPIHYYTDTAQPTTLSSAILATGTSIIVPSLVGYPAQYPFTLRLDPGTSSEELVDVTAAPTGSGPYTLTVTRGVNGTTALAHPGGTAVTLGWTGRDATEAATHQYTQPLLNTGAGVHGLPTGQAVLGYDSSYTVARPDGAALSTVATVALTNVNTINGYVVAPTSVPITASNGWVNVATGYRTLRYQGPDARGLVTVEGYLKSGTVAANTTIASGLPSPQATIMFLGVAWISTTSAAPAFLTLGPAGNISNTVAMAAGSQLFIELIYSVSA
jgi:hypothetical protein